MLPAVFILFPALAGFFLYGLCAVVKKPTIRIGSYGQEQQIFSKTTTIPVKSEKLKLWTNRD